LLCTLVVSDNLSPSSSLKVRDHIPHPYKRTYFNLIILDSHWQNRRSCELNGSQHSLNLTCS
jgi:hypothetical protein